MKITLDIEEGININDLVGLIKSFYPSKKISSAVSQTDSEIKKFNGINDLKILRKENFVKYSREELYDR